MFPITALRGRPCRPRPRPITASLLLITAWLAVTGISAAPAVGAPELATAGSAGVSRVRQVQPGKGTLQSAVKQARPGDVLALHSGTYSGRVFVTTSGTEQRPIVIRPYGDGPVTVEQSFTPAQCSSTQPNVNRTLMFREGVDWWTVQDLRIVGGVWISGTNFSTPAAWIKDQTKRLKSWALRRSLPGRGYVDGVTGVPDPEAAPDIYRALSQTLGTQIDPATGIRILGNDISGRGIHVAVGNRGELRNNTIHDIDCGVGPAIWVNTYSDFWQITGNDVSRVADSTWLHYMQEGIRTGSASSYNTIAHNRVRDLPTDGRGITTDIDASFNLFEFNTVENTAIGLNDQESGWGNTWRSNLVRGVRGAAMVFRGADAKLARPSLNSSTLGAVVECNVATSGGLLAGALMASTFSDNAFERVALSSNLRRYWGDYTNVWNGSSALPPASSSAPLPGRCPPPGA